MSEAKLHVIPDFVDTDLYRPLPRDNEFAVANGLVDPFVVLYGGNIGRMQDWESVLSAAERLSALRFDSSSSEVERVGPGFTTKCESEI